MKKFMLVFISVISFICVFTIAAKSENNSLNLIVGTEGQFTQANLQLVQQKIDDLYIKLNLTDDQKQMAETIGIDSAKKLNIYNVKFIDEKNKLINLRESGAPVQQIQAEVKLIRSLKSRLSITRDKNMQDFEAILTQQQQVDFEQFKTDLKQIKSENNFNRENRQVQTRDDSLENLQNSN